MIHFRFQILTGMLPVVNFYKSHSESALHAIEPFFLVLVSMPSAYYGHVWVMDEIHTFHSVKTEMVQRRNLTAIVVEYFSF